MMNTRVWLVQWRWVVVAGAAILAGVVSGWAQGPNVSAIIHDTGARVGIDTPTPVDKLTVNGIGGTGIGVRSSNPLDGVYINATAGMASAQLGVNRQAPNTGSLLYDGVNGRFSFFVRNVADTGNQEALSILSGQAGAGRVQVMSDMQVNGNIAAKYQDVAEWVKAPFHIAIGSVVVIDGKARDHVQPSSQAYDTRVAGVVSDRPGILLGERASNKVKVASVGRVLVKVDAGYGPVEVGDLLVTSLTPGHAMRSTPVDVGGTPLHRPGTLIGKALEPLPNGQGEILVLLSLH